MKILIISPSINIHGGIRVIVEWANHLSRAGHDVTLQIENGDLHPEWISIDDAVSKRPGPNWNPEGYDVAVATTPYIATRLDGVQTSAKKFFLLQMAENLFAPDNRNYVSTCRRSYAVDMPIIGISQWVEEYVRQYRGDKKMYYIGNGVSDHFQPGKKDEGLTVLAEGWECYNPAKDVNNYGPKCAQHLKEKYGARIIAYSQFPLKTMPAVPDEYYHAPAIEILTSLYQRPKLMIKATRFDARSCAPVEAMACGTVTARAIEKGDDDLIHEYNCLKGPYSLDTLIHNAERILDSDTFRKQLEANGRKYRKRYLSWTKWMEEVEKIFKEDEQEVGAAPGRMIENRRRQIQ